MSKRGFDPKRAAPPKRTQSVIPQILSPEAEKLARGFTEIKVVGIGGAGNNTIDRMIETRVQGIDFIAVNTDAQALANTQARKRIQLGDRLTRGLGTGGDPRVGERATEGARDALEEVLNNADMVFVTAGFGGGTGTGGIPIVAEVAQKAGALTVGIITLPFSFEGVQRRELAREGIQKLEPFVDSLIVISNDRLLQADAAEVSIHEAFRMADETLNQGIHGIADLILTPGLINLDFADVRTVMQRAGPALMATGSASGEGRAIRAAEEAVTNPLLDASIEGARGVLMNVTGGPGMTLYEVNEAAEKISNAAAPDANIIFGAVIHPRLRDEVRITVIATGFRKA